MFFEKYIRKRTKKNAAIGPKRENEKNLYYLVFPLDVADENYAYLLTREDSSLGAFAFVKPD